MNVAEKVWFREARHVEEIQGSSLDIEYKDDWHRIRERMKTVSVALVLCLNIGVDPPDIEYSNQGRKLSWVKPNTQSPQKAAQKIATHLQKLYEKLQPRARYKHAIDPTVEVIKKLCTSLRKNAKDERILFHFNGYGVPKPTEQGEIWVFNKNISQYIPLSLYDLQSWMGVPSVYLWDCNSAGTIVNMFVRLADNHCYRWMEDYHGYRENYPAPIPEEEVFSESSHPSSHAPLISYTTLPSHKDSIQFGACSDGEFLPNNSELPADLFTCCLITPIQTSLLIHMLKTGKKDCFPPNILDELPGVYTDRRTLLGELNWIFTAITDTIAWSSLPTETFQKLFRQDLLIASLSRCYLLAERIMRENGCKTISQPVLPQVYNHPLWDLWEATLDLCLNNMLHLICDRGSVIQLGRFDYFSNTSLKHNLLIELPATVFNIVDIEYAYSRFFIEQLQAFEVWLKFGIDKTSPPQQLPVLLQVLLSQVHRVRALELLAKFVDLGSWAVAAALSVGIFPYVLKLLQCGTKELRPALAFIWAKILSIDLVCQNELIKDDGYSYFIQILEDNTLEPRLKIVPAFVMATLISNNYRPAQEKLIQGEYVNICTDLLSNSHVLQCRRLCLWLLIGLGRLWAEYDKARWHAIRTMAYERVEEFLTNDVPEVRAAAVYALGCFVHNRSRNNEHATTIDNEVCDKLCEKCTFDGSILVRAELVAAIQWFIIDFESRFSELSIELDKKPTHNKENKSLTSVKTYTPMETLVLSENLSSNDKDLLENFRMIRSSSSVKNIAKREALMRNRSLFTAVELSQVEGISSFKQNCLSQLLNLEHRTFKGPFERIWLSLLRLCFDPYEGVSTMCLKLVKHIFDLSESKIKNFRKIISDEERKNRQKEINSTVKFMIGSPLGSSLVMQSFQNTSQNFFRKIPGIENVTQLKQCSSIADLVSNGLVETSSTTFTPKRNLYGSQSGSYAISSGQEDPGLDNGPVQAIVTTHFVDWCSKTFTQPIYTTIFEETSISTRNSLVHRDTPFTVANSTDWALHTYEGLKQKVHKDAIALKTEKSRCETQLMQFRNNKVVTSIAWSFLRPYIYICDGKRISMFNTFNQNTQYTDSVSQFQAYNEPLIEDSITEMMVANELTHELIITGTQKGLIKVWDPMFSEHSHEIENSPKLITGAYVLNDVSRIPIPRKEDETLYRWDQSCGKIICSGNVRVCRLWDAWSEKSVLDVMLKSKNGIVTSIGSDLNCNLLSCGFTDGSFAVFDVRLPPSECQIMNLRNFNSSIIGLSILAEKQHLLVGSKNGDFEVWDPRMYQESIISFNITKNDSNSQQYYNNRLTVNFMDIQKSGEFVGCALSDSTIRLFEVSVGKKCLSQIRYSTSNSNSTRLQNIQQASALFPLNSNPTTVLSTMRFHESQILLGVATSDKFFSIYGLNQY